MFDDLPETIPHKQKGKLRAVAISAFVQVVLVSGIILIQMVSPDKLGEFQPLTTLYMAAPPPPPPPLSAAPPQHQAARRAAVAETAVPKVVEQQPQPVEKPEFTAPTGIPKDI